MRTRVWCTSLVLAALAVACGDQPLEVVPERELPPGSAQQMTRGPGIIALATSSSDDGLSISTDKDDYQPGDTVWFTGAGWPANDTLDILLEDEPATHEPHTWLVAVGEDGTFKDSTYIVDVDDIGVTFTLTAASRATERWLTVVFTDNVNNIVMDNAAPTPFSPNQPTSAGIKDQTTITLDNGTGAANNISVRIRQGTTLAGTLARTLGPINIPSTENPTLVWDGKNTALAFVTDGAYTARLVTVAGSNTTEHDTPDRKRTIVVDNTNPTVAVDAIPGGTQDEEITITGTAGDLPALAGAGLEKVDVTILRTNNTVLTTGSATNTGTNFATWSFSYTPTETGAQKARAKATDNAGNHTTSTDAAFTVVANNSSPTGDAGGPYLGNEGDLIALDGSGSFDPDGDDLTYLWAVEVDETTAPYVPIDQDGVCTFVDPSNATNPNAETLESPSFKCTDDGVFKLTLVVTDENNASSDPSETKVTVKNVKPTVIISPTSKTIDEGGTAGFTATVTDPGTNDDPDEFAFTWTTTVGPCSLSGTPTITSATFSCNDNGSGTVKLAVDDGDEDGAAADEASLTVDNVAPTASGLTTNSPVDEGSDITLALASVFDPSTVDAASLRYAFDCDDGNGYGSATSYATAGATNSASCPTTDNGTRTVKGKVFDKDGGANEYSASVTIKNVPPTIESLTALNDGPLPTTILVNATLELKVTFTDPGTGDTHTAQIDCGAGSYDHVNGIGDDASPFTTSCTFPTIGSKTIKVKVTDDDGGYDVESHVISVLYGFDGLFAPVDRPNTMNVSKAGQAIPLKWRLTDFEGKPILNFSATALGVAVSGLSCSVGIGLDQIEEYAGNSGLQNLGDGYYQYNWKTPAGYANSCRAIGLNLGEATTRGPLAYFNFKK